ncbi:DNase I-like protein [Ceratobasidium sp. AG-I]|nr:DNase I-like protein [Ceratobasidium sp. AG-I]
MADVHQLPPHSPWISESPPSLSSAWAGQPGNEDSDTLLLRQQWLSEQLSSQDAELKQIRNISIRIGTFNVNGQSPVESLRPWLCNPKALATPADLIVLGFQELDLSTEALLITSTTLREDLWCEALMRDLAELGDQYVKLTSKQLVGVLIVVLIRRPLLPLIAPSGVASSSAGVGILGTMGNKGGVALRLQVLDTVLVFINVHLAASAHAVVPLSSDATQSTAPRSIFVGRGAAPIDPIVERRNADYYSLTGPAGRLNFTLLPRTPSAPATAVGLWDGHIAFFLVHLNYRIDLLDDEIRSILDNAHGDYSELLSFDQLKIQQQLQKAFVGMSEGPITFQPTYRCEIGKREGHYWDSKRRPAWTDRILYRAAKGKEEAVRMVEGSYMSHPVISLSDHKPVSADFTVQVEELDRDLASTRLKQLVKKLGRLPLEEDVPRVRLSEDVIDWGPIRYLKPLTKDIKMQNTGIVTAYWRMLPTESGGSLFPDWVTAEPTSGVLLPGDSVTIHLVTNITNDIASQLNAGSKTLDDIIIVHTVRGKDAFVPMMGEWTRTCLAYNPAALVKLPGPVRTSTVSKSAQLSSEKASSSPRELMRLINWLMRHAIECDELFVKLGDQTNVDMIIEVSLVYPVALRQFTFQQSLDTDTAFPFDEKAPGRDAMLAVGTALILFLSEMPEPVIHPKLHVQCGLTGTKEQAYDILDTLPSLNANMWISITAFLHFFCQQDGRKKDGAGVLLLAKIFAEVLWADTMTLPLIHRLSLQTRVGFLMFFIS